MAQVTFEEKLNKEQITMTLMFNGESYFLSNFYPCTITLPSEAGFSKGTAVTLPEMTFASTENAYMAWKTLDLEVRQAIQKMTPSECKKFSLAGQIPLRPDYSNKWRLRAMKEVTRQKFSDANPRLKQRLIDTGAIALVEGTTWNDKFFGFCVKTGKGKNYLGRILMKRRAELKR